MDKIPQYDLADLEWTTKETWVQGESNHGLVRYAEGLGAALRGDRRRVCSVRMVEDSEAQV